MEAIGVKETGWDSKAVGEAYGLMQRIMDSTFIACFQTVLHRFGFIKGISSKLQGTGMDIIQAFQIVQTVRTVLSNVRDQEFDEIYVKIENMAKNSQLLALSIPRRCAKQTHRNKVEADTQQQYFRIAIYLPFIDSFLSQLNSRLSVIATQALQGFKLLPSNIEDLESSQIDAIYDFCKDDLESLTTFKQ